MIPRVNAGMVLQTLRPEGFCVSGPETIRAICQDMPVVKPVMNFLAGMSTRLISRARRGMTLHLSTGLGIADVIRVLRHYRFAGDVVSRERERAQSGQGARKDLFAPALTESGVAP